MRYKCYECKTLFDEPRAVEESRGEFWGMPCSETMYYCPHCGSEEWDEVATVEEWERNDKEGV